jgi:hypothetical protein
MPGLVERLAGQVAWMRIPNGPAFTNGRIIKLERNEAFQAVVGQGATGNGAPAVRIGNGGAHFDLSFGLSCRD